MAWLFKRPDSWKEIASGIAIPMDVDALRSLVSDVSRPAHVSSAKELAQVSQINRASQELSRRETETWIAANPNRCMMLAYLADGWSTYTRSEHPTQVDELAVRRTGRVRNEYLLEQAFFRSRGVDNKPVCHFLTRSPRPLTLGKNAGNMAVAAIEFFGLLREKGCRSVCLWLIVLDGALFKPVKRLLRAYHSLLHADVEIEDLENFGALSALMDWDLQLGCKAHPIQNSIFWALKIFTDADVSKETHLVNKCFRTASTNTNGSIRAVVEKFVVFRDRREDEEAVREFWTLMDVSEKFLDLFVEIDPIFHAGVLWVNPGVESDVKGRARVELCLAYCWRHLDWSDTRWLRSGKSGRYFTRSQLTGHSVAVDMVMNDPCASKQYMKLYGRPGFKIRRLLVVASVAARPMETAHLALLQDDRFLKYGAQWRRDAHQQCSRIADAHPLFWFRMALCVGSDVDWEEVRSWCQNSAAISIGFAERECFSDLKAEPWIHTQGDIGSNVESLRLRERSNILDATTRKAKDLITVGEESKVVEAFETLVNAPGTVQSVEKAHCSGAFMSKNHDYIAETMATRAGLHQIRSRFTADYYDKLLCRIRLKREKLQRRCPEKITGRHMFFAEQARLRITQPTDEEDMVFQLRGVMNTHAEHWNALPAWSKLGFDAEARHGRTLLIRQCSTSFGFQCSICI